MNKLVLTVAASLFVVNAQAATTAASATSASMVKPTETTTVSAPVTAVAPAKKKITVNYTSETMAPAAAADRGEWDGAVWAIQHVGVKYALNDDQAVQFRQYFHYNGNDGRTADKTDEWGMGQSMFRFVDNKQFTIGALTFSGDTRFYIPGAEFERKAGQYLFRHDLGTEQKFGKATVSYSLSTRAYAYTENNDGQRSLRVMPAIGLEYAVNKVVTPFITVYTDHGWYNSGTGITPIGPTAGRASNRPDNRDEFNTDIGAKVAVTKNIGFDAYVTTTEDLRKGDSDYNPFDSDMNTYEIDLTISL